MKGFRWTLFMVCRSPASVIASPSSGDSSGTVGFTMVFNVIPVLELVFTKTFFSYELTAMLGVLLFIGRFRVSAWFVWGLADWIFGYFLLFVSFNLNTYRCAFFISTGLSTNLVTRSVTLASVVPFLQPDKGTDFLTSSGF